MYFHADLVVSMDNEVTPTINLTALEGDMGEVTLMLKDCRVVMRRMSLDQVRSLEIQLGQIADSMDDMLDEEEGKILKENDEQGPLLTTEEPKP